MSSLFHISKFQAHHTNFIKATWLKSFFLGKASLCENLLPETYYFEHAKAVDEAMQTASIIVATSSADPEVTLGYCVFKHPNILHYIYVRHSFKKFGIGKAMLIETGIDTSRFIYTHRTRDCGWAIGYTKKVIEPNGEYKREFVEGKYPGGIYNPYGFLRGE